MSGNGIGPVHAPTAARGNPASNPTPGSSEPRCAASGSPNAMDVRTPSGSPPRTTASKPRSADGTDTPTANSANTRRKRNEKNNTHHTRHHRHMHGARRMRERVGAFARSTGTSNAMTATSPTVERRTNWKPRDGTSTEIIHATASVRTTAISHAANAASGMSDRCTGSNTRDGR